MTDHLPTQILNALTDGELSADQFAATKEHLAGCPACTSDALYQSLLKSATARAGRRYIPPSDLQERIVNRARQDLSPRKSWGFDGAIATNRQFGLYGWAAAVALLVVCLGLLLVQRNTNRSATVASEYAARATEVLDQHIATLAANVQPQVISSDRHTVKPWFQGKLPFSFNLPENLPSGITLDGANLTYLHNRPAAQLLYSIGKHRASIYLAQRTNTLSAKLPTDDSGFHIVSFSSRDIDGVAVSDADLARLYGLVNVVAQAQN